MNASRKTALALGTLAGSLALSGAAFAITPLASGYMVDPQQHAEGQCGVKSMDTDGDGKLSKEEFAAAHEGKIDKFAAHDLDGDGYITQSEMDTAHAKMREAKAAAAQSGDGKSAEGKCGEGKCGEGKCGGAAAPPKKADDAKAGEGKCGEGKCGAGKCGGTR